ncbi:hypothetical protein VTJ04DRAFT_5526 [Mycothermus thermophilus]|uniref:uncharacterized protein n=1 Tax=Humicola insolens TaxID=85995 RepID=UPI003743489C
MAGAKLQFRSASLRLPSRTEAWPGQDAQGGPCFSQIHTPLPPLPCNACSLPETMPLLFLESSDLTTTQAQNNNKISASSILRPRSPYSIPILPAHPTLDSRAVSHAHLRSSRTETFPTTSPTPPSTHHPPIHSVTRSRSGGRGTANRS